MTYPSLLRWNPRVHKLHNAHISQQNLRSCFFLNVSLASGRLEWPSKEQPKQGGLRRSISLTWGYIGKMYIKDNGIIMLLGHTVSKSQLLLLIFKKIVWLRLEFGGQEFHHPSGVTNILNSLIGHLSEGAFHKTHIECRRARFQGCHLRNKFFKLIFYKSLQASIRELHPQILLYLVLNKDYNIYSFG